jgi:hypothetical protein
MKRLIVVLFLVVVGITTLASKSLASEISLAEECSILLATCDDNATLSDSYDFQDNPQYSIFVKPDFTFSLSPSSEISNPFENTEKSLLSSTNLYSKEDPHFRFFIKLE